MNCDSVIFDLDGTLWDSTEKVAESWNMSLRAMGHPLPVLTAADIAAIMGMTEQQIAQAVFAPHFGEKAEEICALCLEHEAEYVAVHGGRIYEGAEELFKRLKAAGKGLAIVSNCQKGYIEGFLAFSGFGGYFSDYECIGRTGLSKAENIRLVMARQGYEQALYLGDTPSDEKSAAAAGCGFVHAAYGFGWAESPLARIAAPLELLKILDLE